MSAMPSPEDRDLHELLRSWDVEPRDDPALARHVWARIEAEQSHGIAGWFEKLSGMLARPVAAIAAIALFAVLGAAIGEFRNSHQREAHVTRLAAEYARSIDPILMMHPADHAGHTP